MASPQLSRRELIASLAALGACRASAPPRPDILLVTICSLRADRVGWQGYVRRPTTPRLDAFAAGAARFGRAWASATWTNASHASILSGRHPGQHRVADAIDVMLPGLPTLPGILRAAGWRAAALVQEDSPMSLPEAAQITRDFEEVWRMLDIRDYDPRLVADWAAARAEPFFAMVHLREAHLPYGDGRPFTDALDAVVRDWRAAIPRPGPGPRRDWTEAVDPLRWISARFDEEGVRDAFDLAYDSGIRAADTSFGRLMDLLRASGRPEPVLVVVGDHGEALQGHKDLLERAVVQVPMFIRIPGLPTVEVGADSSQVDLLPTLAELVGLEVESAGRSLLAGMRGEALPPRAAFTQAIHRDDAGAVVRREAIAKAGLRLVQVGEADFEIEKEEAGRVVHLSERTAEADALYAELIELGRDSWVPAPDAPRPSATQRRAMRRAGYFDADGP